MIKNIISYVAKPCRFIIKNSVKNSYQSKIPITFEQECTTPDVKKYHVDTFVNKVILSSFKNEARPECSDDIKRRVSASIILEGDWKKI